LGKIKYDPNFKFKKEQIFTLKESECNFSVGNCNDFGRRKLGEIRRTAAHAFPGDLDTNEVIDDMLIYNMENLIHKFIFEVQKFVQSFSTIEVLFDFLKTFVYRWNYKKNCNVQI
jgi:hypothetical protein